MIEFTYDLIKNNIHLFDCLTAISKTVELEYIKLGINKKKLSWYPILSIL